MKKSSLFTLVLLGCCLLAVRAQDGAVSRPLQFRLPVEMYVRNYVEPRLTTWMKWDRYEESSAQYRERVSDENKKRKIGEWEQEALTVYKKRVAETIKWKEFRIDGAYDPDNETILIHSAQFGRFAVNVPRGTAARQFVEQFDALQVSDPEFYFSGNTLGLDRLTFILPSTGQRFVYDSKEQHPYTEMNIAYEQGPVDLSLDDVMRPAQTIAKNNVVLGASDVDARIPQTGVIHDDLYVAIIGNENYFYESPTRFSANDARIFNEYCRQTLGVPAGNIFLKEDATYGDMLKAVQFLRNAATAKNGNIRVMFYYSGHGMADVKDNSMYLIPVDGSSLTLQAALKGEQLYKELSDMKARSATVFLDACFSGKSSEGALAALMDGAGIEITPREESLYGNLVVFSATSEAEIAYPYEEKQHRMFTYFLLKRLQESQGNVTYLDLAGYVIDNVKSHAFDINRKTQTPKVQTSHDISDTWKTWTLIKH
jgi:hypothetical protein